MSKHVSNIHIDKEYVSVFASGNSVLSLTDEDIYKIKEKSYTIFLNYAPVKFKDDMMDMLMFSDKAVAKWLYDEYIVKRRDKHSKWITRVQAFSGNNPVEVKEMVDFYFNTGMDALRGNYTIVWLLQILQKFTHKKTILLFGVDMECKDKAKWYDGFTDYDKIKRGSHYNVPKKLEECEAQIKQHIKKDNVFNCNLNSGLDWFIKKNWKEILTL